MTTDADIRTLKEEGRHDEALKIVEDAIDDGGADATLHHSLALLQRRQGDLDAAVESHRTAYALDPKNRKYLEALAITLEQADQRSDAKDVRSQLTDLEAGADELFHTAQADQKRKLLASIEEVVHRCEKQTSLAAIGNVDRARHLFAIHLLDSVADWIQRYPLLYEAGDVATIDEVGLFEIIDPAQVLHKRLARGIPWELPIAALLVELTRRCDDNDLVVDVGANIGVHTVPVAREHRGTVLAFEPVPSTFTHLGQNLEQNHLSNVINLAKACSSTPGHGTMTRVLEHNPGMAQLDVSDEGSTDVTSIDVERSQHGRPIRLIKIDVEGHELDVLRGAKATLEEDKPAILCEISDRSAVDYLVDAGYEPQQFFRSDWVFIPS